jgi:hypothetical protein
MQREYENCKLKSNHSSEEEKVYQGFNKSSRFDLYDEFGFRQQKQYSNYNQYSEIRFNHPIFQELAQARQWSMYYKNESETRARKIVEMEARYHHLYTQCDYLKKEATELKKELSKKKSDCDALEKQNQENARTLSQKEKYKLIFFSILLYLAINKIIFYFF